MGWGAVGGVDKVISILVYGLMMACYDYACWKTIYQWNTNRIRHKKNVFFSATNLSDHMYGMRHKQNAECAGFLTSPPSNSRSPYHHYFGALDSFMDIIYTCCSKEKGKRIKKKRETQA